MKLRLNSTMWAAMAVASRPASVFRSCLTTAPRPSRHLFSSSGVCTGVLWVPSSLKRSLSAWLIPYVSSSSVFSRLIDKEMEGCGI